MAIPFRLIQFGIWRVPDGNGRAVSGATCEILVGAPTVPEGVRVDAATGMDRDRYKRDSGGQKLDGADLWQVGVARSELSSDLTIRHGDGRRLSLQDTG